VFLFLLVVEKSESLVLVSLNLFVFLLLSIALLEPKVLGGNLLLKRGFSVVVVGLVVLKRESLNLVRGRDIGREVVV